MIQKYIKTFCLLAMACGFAACSSDGFQPGNPSTAESPVLFSEDNETSPELTVGQDNSFNVILTREDADEEQTIRLSSKCTLKGVECEDALDVPETVTFNAGESTATIAIAMGEGFENEMEYFLDLSMPEEYTNVYKSASTISFKIKRVYPDDWIDYAPVSYTSEWFEDSWDDEMQYSPIRNAYRIVDWLGYGYSLVFTWDQATGEIALWPEEPLNTGEDDGYGYIWVYSDPEDPFSYDADSKTFTMPLDFYEPDDDYDYGTCTETFTIVEEEEGGDEARR